MLREKKTSGVCENEMCTVCTTVQVSCLLGEKKSADVRALCVKKSTCHCAKRANAPCTCVNNISGCMWDLLTPFDRMGGGVGHNDCMLGGGVNGYVRGG